MARFHEGQQVLVADRRMPVTAQRREATIVHQIVTDVTHTPVGYYKIEWPDGLRDVYPSKCIKSIKRRKRRYVRA